MEILKTAWDFFQNEILGMAWLNRLIGSLLVSLGLDTKTRIGASIQFFLYDVIKNNGTACAFDFNHFIYSELFPTGANKENSRAFPRNRGKYCCGSAGNGNPVLFMFFDTSVYGLYQCGTAAWRYFFFPYFIADG